MRRRTGERPLASATSTDGVVVSGTRDALLIGDHRIPWEQVQSADWDKDSGRLRVAEVGTWGQQRPVHEVTFDKAGRLLELVRERITASVVLQRHVPIRGSKGLFVIARRSPGSDAPLQWVYEFQEGIDPDDPVVRLAAESALAAARDEVGLS